MTKSKSNTERKTALTQVCDADSYVAIIRESLNEEQAGKHNPIHLANILALTAELYLLYYDSLGSSFTTANELAIGLQCKIGKEKDTVEISWLPVAKFKDSASATVEDDSEPGLGDIKNEAKSRAPRAAKTPLRIAVEAAKTTTAVVDAEIVEYELTDDSIHQFVLSLSDEVSAEDYETIKAFGMKHGREALQAAKTFAGWSADVSYDVHKSLEQAVEEFEG